MSDLELASRHFLEGLKALNEGDVTAAETHLLAARKITPDRPSVLVNLSIVYMQQDRLAEALALADSAISQQPEDPLFLLQKGSVELKLERYADALLALDEALRMGCAAAELHNNRGGALTGLKRYDEALSSYDAALALKPDYAEAWNNRGNVLKLMGRSGEALENYAKAIRLKPGHAEFHRNRGLVLADRKQFDAALSGFDEAIRLRPNYAEAHASRGATLKELNRLEEAAASLETAFSLKPGGDYLLGDLLHVKARICDWNEFEGRVAMLEAAIRNGGKAAAPWPALGLVDEPQLQLATARTYARDKFPPATAPVFPQARRGDKIRIGYYSADFHNHATTYLMAEVFEAHDKDAFEIHGFSFGPARNDEMRRRVTSAFDAFHDITELPDQDATDMSRRMGIDIAVDLKGYTLGARPGIFARRAAPIQVSYLGHPGTMGADFIDYIIADRVLIPAMLRDCYTERIVYLPGSYQANDSKRTISARSFTREELGLPPGGFVFCCFNHSYKIMPETFGCWMQILHRVDGSVLWLMQKTGSAADNLRREAARYGVDPARLVFADRMPLPEHLSRHRCADLFLDTLPYNAHTTASDALWAGLPVLTCAGRSFAARVAASLLTALGMPELIAADMQAYEDLAVSLAHDPRRRAAIVRKLALNRQTSSLFSGESMARSLGTAYKLMVSRHENKLAPDDIFIAAGDD